MALPLYLAMTAAEIGACEQLPQHTGWMACHFSPYGTGLSNIPTALPPGTMLMVNDRTPIAGHDGNYIARQLASAVEALQPECVVLDFQRPDCPETAAVAKKILEALPCPAGISSLYAQGFDCPVLLPPPPLDALLGSYLAPWDGRELWLEAAMTAMAITVTEEGSTVAEISFPDHMEGFFSEALCCHYRGQYLENALRFTLWRTAEDLTALLQQGESLGVTKAVGLYQELADPM